MAEVRQGEAAYGLKSVETSSSRSQDLGNPEKPEWEALQNCSILTGHNGEIKVITQLKKVYDFLLT